MTWSRFESGARAHAKCVKAGNEAAAFWMWAIMWSNANGTDGYLDGTMLGAIPPVPLANDIANALASQCVAARLKPGGSGLFEVVDGGYQIHDFHDFQPPADEEQKQSWLSEVRAAAGRKGAAKRWQNANGKPDSKTIPLAGAGTRVGPDRYGSDLDPEGSAEGGGIAKAVLAELRRWPACASLPDPQTLASSLAARFGTLEVAKNIQLRWYLDALGEAAADGVGLNAEALTRKLRAYGDRARRPRQESPSSGQANAPDVEALRSRPTTPTTYRFQTEAELEEKRRKLGVKEPAANG